MTNYEKPFLVNQPEAETNRLKVLVVDDEVELARQICDSLELEGFSSQFLSNPLLIHDHIDKFTPDVLVLDKLMPEKDGIEVLNELKKSNLYESIPVVMLTACNGKFDKIWAFKSGADDYVCKPFDTDELIERIRAVSKRASAQHKKVIGFDGLEVAVKGQFVTVGNTDVDLTVTEFKLLRELMKRKGDVLSRKDICLHVLGKEHTVERTVDVHIVSLRKKLKHLGDKIKTVRGVGYRLIA